MANQLDISVAFVPWIEARDTRLAGRVFPFNAVPPAVSPYCTYFDITHARWHHLKGHTGAHRARIQFDFWSLDKTEAKSIADKIMGNNDDLGLDCYQGTMTGITIQAVIHLDGGDGSEPADDGTENTWFRVRDDYLFYWKERVS